jgi:formylglycine-generating enzyme required for sulfatase activity
MSDLAFKSGDSTKFAEEARLPGACFSDGPMLPEMVVIPPGKFWMGADDEGDKFAGAVEKPRHWVQIDYPLAVSRYPITFEQWDACTDGDPDAHRPDDCGLDRGRRPVINVSWEDAELYVRWLSLAAGRAYRLLSEAEWEFCCRPNAFQLFDMQSKVSELVADAWHDSYQGAPTDGSAWEQNKAAMWRVVRGGGGDTSPGILRCPFRDRVHHLKRMDNMGFRVACGLI